MIGLSLKPGQMPTSNLKAGDQVVLVATSPPNQAADASASQPRAGVLVDRATVFGVDGGSRNNDNTTVSVLIDEADAPAVAAAASASQVTLVLLAAP